MMLNAGTQLGPYEIAAPLGAGGMGEVYLARDSRLDRNVAIKVLPPAFAGDAERVARFQREAKVLASLNHPNIAAVYGFEETEGARFLVLELVEGETLAERLKGGALPVDEVLSVGGQIAEGMEAAHARGVIHRDLKPANVKVTPDGKMKVLDFGLAKALLPDTPAVDTASSPTITATHTREGVILGTAAYMSPEQARGKPLDKRTDIWSFGCVLYECLTGQMAFAGETISDVISVVLSAEPDWELLPDNTPPAVQRLLRRCLRKDPNDRLHDIADARIELDEARSTTSEPEAQARAALPNGGSTRRAKSPLAIPRLVVGVLAIAIGLAMWQPWRQTAVLRRDIVRLSVNLPSTDRLYLVRDNPIAISPDGTRIVYVATRGEELRLYSRMLGGLDPTPIEGTDGARDVFISPDGQWVAFTGSDGKLKKVPLDGGAPVTLCDAHSVGACWQPDGSILFAQTTGGGLMRAHPVGGEPEVLTAADKSKGEFAHWWPHLLPDGKNLLYTIWVSNLTDSQVAVRSLETGETRVLLTGGSNAQYLPSGHLVYTWGNGLMAVPFDPETLQIRGTPLPVLTDLYVNASSGDAAFCISATGTLVYAPGSSARHTLVWVDREGNVQPASSVHRIFDEPRISPDGQRVAVTVEEAGKSDIWILDLMRDSLTPLTFDGASYAGRWSPDGTHLAYSSMREGPFNVYRKAVDGSGVEELVFADEFDKFPCSWSPDGRKLALRHELPTSEGELALLHLTPEPMLEHIVQSPFSENQAEFSPDGRWLAYRSNESGRRQVYVRSVAAGGRKWQVSTMGGECPIWSRDGTELFYHNGGKTMVVPVTTGPELELGHPTVLFDGRFDEYFDVSPDGQRFLMIQADPHAGACINVVLNWFDELKQKAPADPH